MRVESELEEWLLGVLGLCDLCLGCGTKGILERLLAHLGVVLLTCHEVASPLTMAQALIARVAKRIHPVALSKQTVQLFELA